MTYRWRHVVSLLPKGKPIFAPDLPGYGGSVSISKNDKLSAGTTVLNALKSEFKKASGSSSSGSIPVVLIGHDRGARVSHHLTVNGVAGVNILGTCLIDIVSPYPSVVHIHRTNSYRSQHQPNGNTSPTRQQLPNKTPATFTGHSSPMPTLQTA